MNRPEPIAPWTVKDLCIATGQSRPTVVKQLEAGLLPGQKMPGGKWIIPALWAVAWMEGRWQPTAPNAEEITPLSFIRRRHVA